MEPIEAFPEITGPYLGQTPPGRTPRRFAPSILGTDLHTPPIFSADGNSVYWRRMASDVCDDILRMNRENGVWQQPQVVSFASRAFGSDAPFLSPNEDRLYYTSFRPSTLTGLFASRESIWFVEARGDGWTSPRPLRLDGDDFTFHWAFSVAADGTVAFAYDGEIYTATHDDGRYASPLPLGPPINTHGRESMPFLSSDGSLLLFTSDGHPGHLGNGDLYVSEKRSDGSWAPPIHLPTPINSRHQDLYAAVSPDSRYLFFLSNRDGEHSAYWVDFSVVQGLLPDV